MTWHFQIFYSDVLKMRVYLVRDEVLTYGECHLDGVWLMGDWNSVHLELIFAVYIVGLSDSVFEHLLISLLAQDSPDIHSLWFASSSRTGARDEEGEQNQTHFALDGRGVKLSGPWRMRVDVRWLDRSALTASSPAALECDRLSLVRWGMGFTHWVHSWNPFMFKKTMSTRLFRKWCSLLLLSLAKRWSTQFCSNVVVITCVHFSRSCLEWIAVKVLSRVTWCSVRDAVLGAENCARALVRAHSQITPDITELSRLNRLQNICVNARKISGRHRNVWLNWLDNVDV